jgi:hypothetical protein
MVRRKGMGKGQGKGYKNLMTTDKRVHSDSARGIKQPQRVKNTPKKPHNLFTATKDNHILGEFNYMTWGKLIENPTYLFNLEGSNQFFGDFDATTTHLDRTLALSKDFNISQQEDYKKKNAPVVYLYRVVKGKVKKEPYKYNPQKKEWGGI